VKRKVIIATLAAMLCVSNASAFVLEKPLFEGRLPPFAESDECSFANFMENKNDTLAKAKAGDACSQLHIGQSEKDPDVAEDWYKKAADQGLAPAMYSLANLMLKTDRESEGIDYLIKAGNAGHAKAAQDLGNYSRLGRYAAKSPQTACYWYEIAGKHGLPAGQNNFGVCMVLYPGAPGLEAGAKLYAEAAKQSDNVAEYNLGIAYEADGQAVKAIERFNVAAGYGSVIAMVHLGDIYRSGEIAPQDLKAAFGWYMKASKTGNPLAKFNVGRKLRIGEGTAKSEEQAVTMFKFSSDHGYSESSRALSEMYAVGWTIYREKEIKDKKGKVEIVTVSTKIKPDLKQSKRFKEKAIKQIATESGNDSAAAGKYVFYYE